MQNEVMSSTEVDSLDSSLTSGFVGCAEQLETCKEYALAAFKRNEIIRCLIEAMDFYNDDDLAAEMPEDFNGNCLSYLSALSHYNRLTINSLLNKLKEV